MTYTIHHADVLEALRGMDADSYSGCLTDPPYGLTTDGGKTGFMGHAWDKGVPPVEVWREVLRVLRPGAYLLAFGGTRTSHRLTCAIEDAGFEIRDSIAQFFDQDAATQAFLAGLSPEQRKNFDRAFVGSPIAAWCFGSGFPKSHNVSAAIDREAGAVRGLVERERPDGKKAGHATTGFVAGATDSSLKRSDVALTEAARQWAGHGTALKPAWEPIIVARKPLEGTVAQNVQRWGCGALAIDASRVGTTADERQVIDRRSGAGRGAMFAHMGREEGERFTSSPLGRWPANVILSHSPDCVEVGTREVVSRGGASGTPGKPGGGYNGGLMGTGEPTGPGSTVEGTKYMRRETVAKFDCAPGCPVAALDAQGGHLQSHGGGGTVSMGYRGGSMPYKPIPKGDSDGASRFFRTFDHAEGARFMYCAKASRKERDAGVEGGSSHPCVKPLALTTYLARLILPPVEGARMLNVFCGSGSEMLGGLRAGWSHVEGVDSWDVAVKIAKARLAHHEAQSEPANDEAEQLTLDQVGT